MTSPLAQVQSFSFDAQELTQKLAEHIPQSRSGHWQISFNRLSDRKEPVYWHLGISQGEIFYSGSQLWTARALLKIIQRYVSTTRQEEAKAILGQFQHKLDQESLSPPQVVAQLEQQGVLRKAHLAEALRLKILSDLDTYCLLGAGESQFIPDNSLSNYDSIPRFNIETIIDEAVQRQFLWHQLKKYVPSMSLIPSLDQEGMGRSELTPGQQVQIQNWVNSGKTLNNLAIGLAKDSIEIAKIFAKLVSAGVVKLNPPTQFTRPTVMIIDDSPLVLKQFQHWATSLGYAVVVSQTSETALSIIMQTKPSVIFIDINMPGLSGFELVRQIRQRPQISATPLVILTGEQKLSNKWRAQWSGCDFLTKPLSADAVEVFQEQLQALLHRLTADPASSAAA